MWFNQRGYISTLNASFLKLVNKFTYTLNASSLKVVDKFTNLGSRVTSIEADINMRLAKAWTAINRLSVKWKSDLTDKIKRSFLQEEAVLILLYGCTTWTLTKRMEKKLDGNYTRMLRAILNDPRGSSYHPSRKLSKLDEPDKQHTAGEVGINS